jgi:CubicO group peptidase (beta-lactamase class C family)
MSHPYKRNSRATHILCYMLRPNLWLCLALVGCATAPARHVSASRRGPLNISIDSSLGRRIDLLVLDSMRARNIPGASIAVLRHDTLIYIAGYGVTRLEKPVAVRPTTIFQIASLTKPFTAMAILMLMEDGAVELDAPASQYVPELPSVYSSLTIRQLLTHTSGISPDMRRANIDEMDLPEFWRRLAERPVGFPPGTKIQYANAGYTVLSIVVERASRIPFEEFLRRRIFEPLGMTSSGYRVPERDDSLHAVGYEPADGRNVAVPHVFSGWGNSGIESTATDLARFAAAIERRELLRASSYDLMFSPGKLASGQPANFTFSGAPTSYGFGWFLTTYLGKVLQTHGGAVAGFSSILDRFPEQGYSIVALSNSKQGTDRLGQADALARTIAGVLGEARRR